MYISYIFTLNDMYVYFVFTHDMFMMHFSSLHPSFPGTGGVAMVVLAAFVESEARLTFLPSNVMCTVWLAESGMFPPSLY